MNFLVHFLISWIKYNFEKTLYNFNNSIRDSEAVQDGGLEYYRVQHTCSMTLPAGKTTFRVTENHWPLKLHIWRMHLTKESWLEQNIPYASLISPLVLKEQWAICCSSITLLVRDGTTSSVDAAVLQFPLSLARMTKSQR